MATRQGPVLPLFIAEPDLWQQPDYSARQWAFVEESLIELRNERAGGGEGVEERDQAPPNEGPLEIGRAKK